MQYIGYSGPPQYDKTQFISIGVNNMMFNRYPFYVCTDIEQNFNWSEEENPQQIDYLTQYPGTKRIYPTSKKPATFLYKVPAPWRQYVDTGVVRRTTTDQHING